MQYFRKLRGTVWSVCITDKDEIWVKSNTEWKPHERCSAEYVIWWWRTIAPWPCSYATNALEWRQGNDASRKLCLISAVVRTFTASTFSSVWCKTEEPLHQAVNRRTSGSSCWLLQQWSPQKVAAGELFLWQDVSCKWVLHARHSSDTQATLW